MVQKVGPKYSYKVRRYDFERILACHDHPHHSCRQYEPYRMINLEKYVLSIRRGVLIGALVSSKILEKFRDSTLEFRW